MRVRANTSYRICEYVHLCFVNLAQMALCRAFLWTEMKRFYQLTLEFGFVQESVRRRLISQNFQQRVRWRLGVSMNRGFLKVFENVALILLMLKIDIGRVCPNRLQIANAMAFLGKFLFPIGRSLETSTCRDQSLSSMFCSS